MVDVVPSIFQVREEYCADTGFFVNKTEAFCQDKQLLSRDVELNDTGTELSIITCNNESLTCFINFPTILSESPFE